MSLFYVTFPQQLHVVSLLFQDKFHWAYYLYAFYQEFNSKGLKPMKNQ